MQVPTGIAASIFHIRAGNVKARASGVLALTCATGMFVTSTYVTMALPEDHLRYIFATMLGLCSLRMITQV